MRASWHATAAPEPRPARALASGLRLSGRARDHDLNDAIPDADGVDGRVIPSCRPNGVTVPHVVLEPVPWTAQGAAFELPLGHRSTSMRAAAVNREDPLGEHHNHDRVAQGVHLGKTVDRRQRFKRVRRPIGLVQHRDRQPGRRLNPALQPEWPWSSGQPASPRLTAS